MTRPEILRQKRLNGATTTYVHDDTNQLTADGNTTVTYDGTGNRNNGSYTTGTGNRITSDGTWTYTHNEEGNLIKKTKGVNDETWTYGYNHRNQMIWVEKRATDGGTLQLRTDYEYDALGNRIRKQVDDDGDTTIELDQRYAYDGWKPGGGFVGNENWDVWADLDDSNDIYRRYIRGDMIDELLVRIESGDAVWNLNDRMGSVRDILDKNAVLKSTIKYDGFGGIISETGKPWRGRYTWTGRELDEETELQYNRARYYDSAIGRWTSEDPIRFGAGDSNLYRYIHNRPVVNWDPSGLARELTRSQWPNWLRERIDNDRLYDERFNIIGRPAITRIVEDFNHAGVTDQRPEIGSNQVVPIPRHYDVYWRDSLSDGRTPLRHTRIYADEGILRGEPFPEELNEFIKSLGTEGMTPREVEESFMTIPQGMLIPSSIVDVPPGKYEFPEFIPFPISDYAGKPIIHSTPIDPETGKMPPLITLHDPRFKPSRPTPFPGKSSPNPILFTNPNRDPIGGISDWLPTSKDIPRIPITNEGIGAAGAVGAGAAAIKVAHDAGWLNWVWSTIKGIRPTAPSIIIDGSGQFLNNPTRQPINCPIQLGGGSNWGG